MVALSTPRTRSPVARAGSKSSLARACQRKALRNALLTCRATTQSRSGGCSNYEITRTPGESAGDPPVRRRERRAGVTVVSEPGVRALARLVSRRDAAQGNGANGQRVGERAEHDISAAVTYRGRCGNGYSHEP